MQSWFSIKENVGRKFSEYNNNYAVLVIFCSVITVRTNKDSIFEGTVTKIVYEISDGSLTLCYAFIDSCDQQLDYICIEDLSEAVWEPLTNLQQPKQKGS